MAENWAGIAAEIEEAVASVGFEATLEQPAIDMGTEYDADQNSSPPAYTETITVIDDQIRRVDRESGRVGVSRVLTMAATGTVPVKGWRVQVRGSWHRIAEVVAVAPGGTDLLFDLVLEG